MPRAPGQTYGGHFLTHTNPHALFPMGSAWQGVLAGRFLLKWVNRVPQHQGRPEGGAQRAA
jgi:hypothetical protein